MVEKIYKKVIYALARVAVKYIEYKKKRQQNKSVNYINSTKSESDIEYNKKAIADNVNGPNEKYRRTDFNLIAD